ncbi:hypothetical protein CP061683_0687, partial [Chlamydia psittaci 06-1683]
MLHELR